MNMENKRYDKWLREIEKELALLEGLDVTSIARIKQTLPIIDKVMLSVKEQVLADGFADSKAEIYFFKHVKPAFQALRLYEILLYRFASNIPPGTDEMIRQYYQQDLLSIMRELHADNYHYQYFKSGATESDAVFFLRDSSGGDIPITELNEQVPGFSSPLDFSVARYMALERMQEHLLDLLAGTVQPLKKKTTDSDKKDLKWTGESINLVELAYGIWLTGQINNGNASISQIVEWLELNLEANIGMESWR